MEQTNLVIGNSTIDAILLRDIARHEGHKVILEHEGTRLEIAVKEDKGTIKPGGKYEAKDYFAGKVQNFPKREQFGGGGYNSVSYLRKLLDNSFTVHYLDVSNPSLDTSVPGESLADKLRQQDIEPEFLCMRPIPLNLVFSESSDGRSDKIIVKSPLKTDVMNQYTRQKAADLIGKAYAVLFNSLKDENLASIVLDESRKNGLLMGVITTSLDPDYVLKQVVPYCVCQFNYDEFGFVVNPNHKVEGNENDRIESAIEGIRNLRKGHSARQNIYVTLGKNGVLCSDTFGIYHVRLKDEKLTEINDTVKFRDESTCGAGDAFAASVFRYEMLQSVSVEQIAKLACRDAVRYLGYSGEVRDWDFKTKKFRV